MSTMGPIYDADFTTYNITLAGLVNGAWRQGPVVDNRTDKFADVLISGKIQTGAVAPLDGGSIEILAYGEYDDNVYSAGCTGLDAAYVGNGQERNLVHVATIIVDDTANQDYQFTPRTVARSFGGLLPPRYGFVFRNRTAQTLDTTGTNFEVLLKGVRFENV